MKTNEDWLQWICPRCDMDILVDFKQINFAKFGKKSRVKQRMTCPCCGMQSYVTFSISYLELHVDNVKEA